MLILSQVVLPRISFGEEFDLRGGIPESEFLEFFCIGIHDALDFCALFLRAWVESRAVLRSYIVALAETLRGIVRF